MRKMVLLAAIALTSLAAAAQEVAPIAAEKSNCKVRYQGEVIAGVGIGIPYVLPLFEVQTIHGIRVGDHFSAGIGVGLDMISLALPIYVNVRGYLPVSQKTSLFLGLDLGTELLQINFLPAFYYAPAFGASFKVSKNSAINASLVYKGYHVAPNSMLPGGLVVRVGFQF